MYNNQSELKCQQQGHENGQILGVCTFPQCIGKRPFCLGCKFQLHCEHQDSLKKFEDLENWKNQNCIITNTLQKLQNELKDLLNFIEKVIQSTQPSANSNFTQMDYTTLDNSISNLIKSWKQQEEIYNNLEKMMESPITQAAIQAIFAFQNRYQSANLFQTGLNQNLYVTTPYLFNSNNQLQNDNNKQIQNCQALQQQQIVGQNIKQACNQIPIIQGQNKFSTGNPIQADSKQNKGGEATIFIKKLLQQNQFPANQQQNLTFQNNNQFKQVQN